MCDRSGEIVHFFGLMQLRISLYRPNFVGKIIQFLGTFRDIKTKTLYIFDAQVIAFCAFLF